MPPFRIPDQAKKVIMDSTPSRFWTPTFSISPVLGVVGSPPFSENLLF